MLNNYRKDIDGLRALAVISVVLFHLDISWIKSGFLGVDIFFVISGYLITSIIIRDLNNKDFSIKNFYLRRIRRILPALITVLIVSTSFAWLILLPQDLQNYSKSLIASVASFSNIFFFNTLNFGYFSSDSSVIPLLHTWSLGIEEQFYIFWPIILIIAYRLNFTSRRKLIALSSFIMFISIIFFFYKNSAEYYYFPTTRAFELLFGCILAITISNKQQATSNKQQTTNNKQQTTNNIFYNILSLLSIVLMLAPILCINVIYPSIWTVVTCFGATLFIYVGSNQYIPIANKLLSFKPFVAIGLISYSLYLWHWPIITYLNYLSIEKTTLVNLLVIFISFTLATLTYFFIEKPFRHKFKLPFSMSLIALWIIPILIAIIFAFGSTHINNFGFNQKPKSLSLNYYGGDIQASFGCHTGQDYNKDIFNTKCFIGDTKKKHSFALVLGDSHAMADQGMISIWLKDLNEKGYIYTKSLTGNPIYYKYIMYNKDFIDTLDFFIKKLHPKSVVLAGIWDNQTYEKNNSYKIIDNSINFLIKQGITPIIMKDVPELGDLKPACGLSNIEKLIGKKCYINIQTNKTKAFVDKLQNKYKQLVVIDPTKVYCENKKCLTSINGTNLYFNDSHLSYAGSKLIGKIYMKEYGNPLANIIK
ncbi:acyltransferase family protein [Francisellaceae bacterium CB300]